MTATLEVREYDDELAARKDGTRPLACHEIPDANLMFPDNEEEHDGWGRPNTQLQEARAVCASCWFKTPCLEAALDRRERWGVWGGTVFRERETMRRYKYKPEPVAPADEALFDVQELSA